MAVGVRCACAVLGAALSTNAAAQPTCPGAELPAYSHNDYRNSRPLHDAVERGFRGVEVDVFLINGVLRVGHDRREAARSGSFESLYLTPLETILAECGRASAGGRPFLLAIEIKESSPASYDSLVSVLGRHQSLFARDRAAVNGPPAVEVVLVGWYPKETRFVEGDSLFGVQYRIVAPNGVDTRRLTDRVRMVSVDYGKAIRPWWHIPARRERWLTAIRRTREAAGDRLLRVHNLPVDLALYATLLDAGVDLIGSERLPRTQPLINRIILSRRDRFWSALRSICGGAYAGELVEGNASDSAFRNAELRMHVRSCTPTEIRIPFHLGENRSRTWVITRTGTGLRLKHDHRHEDGSEDAITQYGGDTRSAGTSTTQEFHADAHTASLIPAARTNVWTVEMVPGARFAYALRREGTDRRFRVAFDLTKPVPPPPPPWGSR